MTSTGPELVANELYGRILLPEHLPGTPITAEPRHIARVISDYSIEDSTGDHSITLADHELFAFNALLLCRDKGPLSPSELAKPAPGHIYHPNTIPERRAEYVAKSLVKLVRVTEEKLNIPGLIVRTENSKRRVTYHIGDNIEIDQSDRRPSAMLTPVEPPAYNPKGSVKSTSTTPSKYTTLEDGYLKGREDKQRITDELIDTALELARYTGSRDTVLYDLIIERAERNFSTTDENERESLDKSLKLAEETVIRLRAKAALKSKRSRQILKA